MTIHASQLNGYMEIASSLSDATMSQINGNLEANISLPADGDIQLTSVNAEIFVRIPTNTSAEVSDLTANGSVSTSNLTFSNLINCDHSLSGILGDGNGEIKLNSANGDITLNGQ